MLHINDHSLHEKIVQQKTQFKIILKTINELFFLQPWINHYSGIFGKDSIIVADNMSTCKKVLKIYERNKDITTCYFEGNHNTIHCEEAYLDFYKAIKESCEYFIILDTDEFLIYIDENEWHKDLRVKEELNNAVLRKPKTIQITSISNKPKSLRRYEYPSMESHKWGKPFISNSFEPLFNFIHNCQISDENEISVQKNLAILHLNKLNAKQRDRINIQKLAKRGLCSIEDSYNDLLKLDWENWSEPTARRFLLELIELHDYIHKPGSRTKHLQLMKDNSVKFVT